MRIFRLIVATILVATLAPAMPASSQELPPGGTFVDDDGSVHEPAIEALVAAGITEGCDQDLYCPEDPVTRGQMASFLVRALDSLPATSMDWFSDDDGSPHEANINVIAAAGVTLGYADGTFRPENLVTRAEMASFLARSLPDLTDATQDWFSDDDGSPHEANINVIAENQITLGYSDGTYQPMANITRGEMATMLMRALGLDPITPRPRTEQTAVYFFMESFDDDPLGPGPFLVPVARTIPQTITPATDSMTALLEGPTTSEGDSHPAISTQIRSGTDLGGVVIENGVATVSLDGDFAPAEGVPTIGAVGQVVYTLTQFPTVDEVAIDIAGVPLDQIAGLDAPYARDDFLDADIVPTVFVDQPAYGGPVDNPARIVGRTVAFEAQFRVTITDADGLILTETSVLAGGPQIITPDGAPWTSFDTEIDYQVDTEQVGALIVSDTSAQDGSRIAVREYPVMLTP